MSFERTKRMCLLCDHFEAEPPKDWQPRYPGNVYDVLDALRKNEGPLNGRCVFNPVPVLVSSDHYCGQFAVSEEVVSAAHTLKMQGRYYRENKKLEGDIAALRQQLKVARDRSAVRLAELQKLRVKRRPKLPRPDDATHATTAPPIARDPNQLDLFAW